MRPVPTPNPEFISEEHMAGLRAKEAKRRADQELAAAQSAGQTAAAATVDQPDQ